MKRFHICGCFILILFLGISFESMGCKPVTPEGVVSSVINAYSKVNTYSIQERLTAIHEVVGGNKPGTRVTSQNSTGIISIENRQFEMNIMQDGQPIEGMQTFTRQYLANEWLYIKTDVLDYEDKDHEVWVKLELNDEQLNRNDRLWEDNNPLGQQIELLSTATEVIITGNDKINGGDTYVLNIKPDWQVLTDWLSLQPPYRGPRFFDLPELAKSLSFQAWVCKETFLILKSEIEMNYEMVSFDSSNSMVDFKGEITFNDYNKPFEIELPEEALNAVKGPIA